MARWTKVTTVLRRLAVVARDDRGVTLVEYGFIVSLVSIVAIGLLLVIGEDLTNPVPSLVEALVKM